METVDTNKNSLVTAQKLGRHAIGIDLNPAYIKLSDKRRRKELGMFNPVITSIT